MTPRVPTNLRNIGPVAAEWLAEVGVNSLEDLQRIGVVTAYALVKRHHAEATLNLLWALEGAANDCDWRDVTVETKQRLKTELAKLMD